MEAISWSFMQRPSRSLHLRNPQFTRSRGRRREGELAYAASCMYSRHHNGPAPRPHPRPCLHPAGPVVSHTHLLRNLDYAMTIKDAPAEVW